MSLVTHHLYERGFYANTDETRENFLQVFLHTGGFYAGRNEAKRSLVQAFSTREIL